MSWPPDPPDASPADDARLQPPEMAAKLLRWLERYITEQSPSLQLFAEVAHELARRSR